MPTHRYTRFQSFPLRRCPAMRRAKVRLTDLTIRNLKPRGARRHVQDADIPGFGVLVTATGDTERSELPQGAHIPGVACISVRVRLRGQKFRPGCPEAPRPSASSRDGCA